MPDQTSESPNGGNRQGFQRNQSPYQKGLDMDSFSQGDENSKLPVPSTSSAAVVAYKGVPVMTTERLAQGFHVAPKTINDNFNNNKDRYKEGRDYFLLKGAELKAFKNYPENFGVVDPKAPSLYLWPERGAFRHCKSIGTDVAWAMFDEMADTYFAVKSLPASEVMSLPVKVREVASAFRGYYGIARLAGLDRNQASLAANRGVMNTIGADPLGSMGLTHFLAPQQEGHLTATQIGEQVGLKSAQMANKKLDEFGFQVREIHSDAGWKPTPKGEKYAVWLDTGKRHGDGTPVRQLRWSSGIVEALKTEMNGRAA